MSDKPNVERMARNPQGLKIDPDTAEVIWHYAQTLDPYGDARFGDTASSRQLVHS
jgi:glucose/arabinose dehydrogenase